MMLNYSSYPSSSSSSSKIIIMVFVSWLILGPIAASGSTLRPLLNQVDGLAAGQHRPPPRRDEDIGIVQRKNAIVAEQWINDDAKTGTSLRNFLLAPSHAATSSTNDASSSSIGSFSSSTTVLTPTMIHQQNDHEGVNHHFVNSSQLQRKLPPASCLDTPGLCPSCHALGTCCMQDNFNIYGGSNSLGCTTNSLKIQDVVVVNVADPDAYQCNCNAGVGGLPACTGDTTRDCQGKNIGTYFGVCTPEDTNVTVTFASNIQISNAEFDVALYINTKGRSAKTGSGECVIHGLQQQVPTPSPLIGHSPASAPTDQCLDLLGAGSLVNYPFLPPLTLSCTDSNNDEYLDFSVGFSFSNQVRE